VGVLLAASCFAQSLEVDLVKQQVIQERLKDGVVPPAKRQAAIRDLFEQAGCSPQEQAISKKTANIICTLPGETSSTIVVGGHFDFADRGAGIVDDWSGVSLLPSLYQALKTHNHRHRYVFVAFASEERGLVGSSYYVKHLSHEENGRIDAFVNLECLGLTPAKVWVHRSDQRLVARLAEVAAAVHLNVQGVNVEKVGDDDTHPFVSVRIPAISIHSVTQETLPILHSVRDQVSAIHPDEYYDAYKLAAFIWLTWM
jgi:Zn-dependent M28 family amino/carboxypeptidase